MAFDPAQRGAASPSASGYQYVHGAVEAIALLNQFPVEMEVKIARAGLRRMGEVVAQAIRFRVPTRTGLLAGTVRVTTRKRGKEISAGVRIGNRKKGIFYAHMVLGGTRPHQITARGNGALRILGGIIVKKIQHPGARANPFVEQAQVAARYNAFQSGFALVTELIKRYAQKGK